MPGEVQTQTVTVHNQGTGNEDIWLAFDNANYAWSAVNDLGQYGKFVINGKTYDNLNNKAGGSTTGVPGSPIAGSFMTGSCSTVNRVPINYLPSRILLGTLTAGQVWTFDVSFNIIACKSTGGGGDLWSSVANDFTPLLTGPLPLNFKIAAFQPGVNPTDPFNGGGESPTWCCRSPTTPRASSSKPGIAHLSVPHGRGHTPPMRPFNRTR